MQNLMAEVLEVATAKEAGIVGMEAVARVGEMALIETTEPTGIGVATIVESIATAGIEVGAGAWTGAWIVNTKDLEAGAGVLIEMICMTVVIVVIGVCQETMIGGLILTTRRK